MTTARTQEHYSNRARSTAMVGQMVDAYYQDLKNAPSQGRLVAWAVGFPVIFPMLRAMDIAYLHGEGYSARVAGRKEEKEPQAAAEAAGYLMEACSYARTHIGCALLSKSGGGAQPTLRQAQGSASAASVMPRPNFVVSANPGCSTEVHWFDDICRRWGVPGFHLEVPHNWEQSGYEDRVKDVTRQLGDFALFLEDIAHQHYPWEKLKEVMGIVQKAATRRKEAMKLCHARPSPATFFDWAIGLGPVNYLVGLPETVDFFDKMHAELKERVARGEGAVKRERFRLYWDGLAIWNRVGWLAEKFAALDASVVLGRYTHLGFFHEPEKIDPQKPLESLAANVAGVQLNQSLDWLIDTIAGLCQEYSVDGLVMTTMRTCRPFSALQLPLAEGVSRKLGIPAVVIEGDMVDTNFYSDAQWDTKLQALMETIEARKR